VVLLVARVVPPVSSGRGLADWLIAWGTVGLGVVTVLGLGVTMFLARAARLSAARALADERERARGDREDAERRLRDERAHAELVRRRDRQQESVAGLLGAIASLMPFWEAVPNLYRDPEWKQGELPARERDPWRRKECEDALRALRYAADAQLSGLGAARAAEQFRMLVYLAQGAARGVPRDLRVRAGQDLRRYAIFVRLSLEGLSDAGEGLDPGVPACPVLERMPVHDTPWYPSKVAPGWAEAVAREPDDPFYQPAP